MSINRRQAFKFIGALLFLPKLPAPAPSDVITLHGPLYWHIDPKIIPILKDGAYIQHD